MLTPDQLRLTPLRDLIALRNRLAGNLATVEHAIKLRTQFPPARPAQPKTANTSHHEDK